MNLAVHVPEPVGDDVAAICTAVRALDPAAALTSARAVPTARRAAVREVLDVVAPLFRYDYRFHDASPSRTPGWPAVVAFRVAMAALETSPVEVASHLGGVLGSRDRASNDAALAIVGAHPPAWRRRLVHSLLHGRWGAWRAVHGLVLAGLVDVPDDPEYAAQLVVAIRWQDLPTALAADPSLDALLHQVWSLPDVGRHIGRADSADEMPGRSRPSWYGSDRSVYTDAQWSGLLEAWGANDPKRRPAVVDGCLAALAGAGGTSPADLRGWVLVHGRIGVTLDEAAQRQTAYLDLVAGGGSPAATLGRAQLVNLMRAGRLDPVGLLEATPDVLSRPEKIAVREHLALLAAMVRSGGLDPRACAEVVQPIVGRLPSGMQPHVDKLLVLCDVTPVTAPGVPGSVTEVWGAGRPVGVPAPEPVVPVASTDELVDLLVRVLHDPGDPIEVERAVDGMLRLRGVRPGVEQQLLHGVRDGHTDTGLFDLVVAWLGRRPEPRPAGRVSRLYLVHDASLVPGDVEASFQRNYPVMRTPRADGTFDEVGPTSWTWRQSEIQWTPVDLVKARLQELQPLVEGPPTGQGLLGLPTARHGTLSLDALRERLARQTASGVTRADREVATALMRLEPPDRTALCASGVLGDDALRWFDVIGSEVRWRWVVAQPSRWAYGYSPHPVGPLRLWQPEQPSTHGGLGTEDPVRLWFDSESVVTFWDGHSTYAGLGDSALSSCLLYLPSHPDLAAVHVQPEVITWIEQPEADLSGLLRLMADRRVPLGAPSTDLLLWASSYRSARTRAAAAEAIAATARAGTLDARTLGEGILRLVGPGAGPFLMSSFHLQPEPPKLSRIAATLADVSRIDEHGERAVLGAVTACLPALRDMRGGVALLETAAAIAVRRGVRVELPEPLASLAEGRSTTRTAQEARRLGGAGRTATPWRSTSSGNRE
ncbi:MAG: hypothetical protein HGA44_07670 [Cellulomonadaceae bacterium]|nr:hypothetical protein [Cellulomonadaceae bacterium]